MSDDRAVIAPMSHSAESGLVGFTAQRRGADGKPVGKRLTFLPDSFVIEPLRCICPQTTSRLFSCPVHPHRTRDIPPGRRDDR